MRILGLKELSSVHTSLVQKPEVVEFAMKFLNSVLTCTCILSDGQVMFWGEFNLLQKNCYQSCSDIKIFFPAS